MPVTSRRSIHQHEHSDKKSQRKLRKEITEICDTHKKEDLVELDSEDERQKEQQGIVHHTENEEQNNLYPNLGELKHFSCESIRNNIPDEQPSIKVTRIFIFAFIVILCGLSVNYLNFYSEQEKAIPVNVMNQTNEEIIFDKSFYNLENTYNKQDERVWFTLAAGIKSVTSHDPNRPSVFLLLFDSEEAGKTAKCLISDVIKIASKYLMQSEKEPLLFGGASLNNHIEDSGKLIKNLKPSIISSGFMVITDLQEVHPQVATSFHFFCDSYSPLVQKSVYFFTLKMENIPKLKHFQKTAENYLNDLWSSLPDNLRLPLITRMTPNVLRIVSDTINCSW